MEIIDFQNGKAISELFRSDFALSACEIQIFFAMRTTKFLSKFQSLRPNGNFLFLWIPMLHFDCFLVSPILWAIWTLSSGEYMYLGPNWHTIAYSRALILEKTIKKTIKRLSCSWPSEWSTGRLWLTSGRRSKIIKDRGSEMSFTEMSKAMLDEQTIWSNVEA